MKSKAFCKLKSWQKNKKDPNPVIVKIISGLASQPTVFGGQSPGRLTCGLAIQAPCMGILGV